MYWFCIRKHIRSLSPGILIPQIPVEYNVLLNDGNVTPLTFSTGHHLSTLLENLAPFTQYEIRIQACQNGESLSHIWPWLSWKSISLKKIALKRNRFSVQIQRRTFHFLFVVDCLPRKIKAWHRVKHYAFLHIKSWIFKYIKMAFLQSLVL